MMLSSKVAASVLLLVVSLVIGYQSVAIAETPHRVVKIIIADAVFPVFDPNAKDVFVFTGPPPVEDPPVPAKTPPGKLPSLTASCASCHQAGGKVRGSFELFDARGKLLPLSKERWREVLDRITRPASRDGAMPPPDANKPAVTPADAAEVRRLSGG